jgi:hypothetical protein
MPARVAKVMTLALVALLLVPAAVHADGDPASDVLLVRDVFFSYDPPPTPALQKTLNTEVAAARRASIPVKVALIRAPFDLGLIPELYGKPQQYADFLGQEISLQYKGPLLVVMAAGYGMHRVSAAARAAVAQLSSPSSNQIDALAQAAITAISRIAAASGHSIGPPSSWGAATSVGSGAASGGSSVGIIAAIVAAVTVVAAAGLLAARRHSASRKSGHADGG